MFSKYVSTELLHIDVFISGTTFLFFLSFFFFFFFFFASDKAPETNKKDLLAEYELMKQLQPHPNVIRLMGAVTLSGTFIMNIWLLVTPYLLVISSNVRHKWDKAQLFLNFNWQLKK